MVAPPMNNVMNSIYHILAVKSTLSRLFEPG